MLIKLLKIYKKKTGKPLTLPEVIGALEDWDCNLSVKINEYEFEYALEGDISELKHCIGHLLSDMLTSI